MVLGPQGPGRVGRRRFFRYAGRLRAARRRIAGELRREPQAPRVAEAGGSGAANDRTLRASDRTRSLRAARVARAAPDPHAAVAPAAAPAPLARPARGTAAQAPGADPDACARTLCAAALGADAGRGWARPGRPPSRPRSRPRATGTSGPRVQHRARAAQACVLACWGTCVRKLRSRSDGLAANVCTHGRGERNWLYRAGLGASRSATGVAAPVALRARARAPEEPPSRGRVRRLELDCRDGCYACQAFDRRVLHGRRAAPKAHGEVRHRRRRPAVGHDGPGRKQERGAADPRRQRPHRGRGARAQRAAHPRR